jgi:hypothetical protein
MYSHLSALSDAERARRGLSRATLAHDVSVSCDTATLSADPSRRTRAVGDTEQFKRAIATSQY